MAGKYRNLYYGLNKYVFSLLPDVLYHNLINCIMHFRFGMKCHWLNIGNPKTFSEKLQWLKTHGDIELKTRLADKYDVRQWVAEKIGEQYLVDLLPVTNGGGYLATTAEEIDFEKLPNEFALKLTKGSGYNIICRNKAELDITVTRETLRRWLKVNNWYLSREPQYRGRNRIYCEQMLEYNITDYKFFCFSGEPFMLKIDVDRFTGHRANYYDLSGNLLDVDERCYPRNPDINVQLPAQFDEMLGIVRRLADGFPFVRVDLYVHNGKVYFGEMTFHPSGGYSLIEPFEWERKLGDMINLEK